MKTSIKSCLFLVIALVCLLQGVHGLESVMSIKPPRCVEAIDSSVHITCHVKGVTKGVLLIQISRRDEEPLALLSPGSVISYSDNRTKVYQATGIIDDDHPENSHLNVTIFFPRVGDIGLYTCSMALMDDAGLLTHASSVRYLDVERTPEGKVDTEMNAMQMKLDVLTKQVESLQASSLDGWSMPAFSAAVQRQKYFFEKGMTIVFDEVLSGNNRPGYNPRTGVFTAPVSGLYAFFLVIEIEDKNAGGAFNLVANNRPVVKLYVEDTDFGDQSSVSAVVELMEGQEVKVQVNYREKKKRAWVYHNRYSVFSGFLIKPF